MAKPLIAQAVDMVRRLKDQTRGKNLSRLHRVESELMTVAGKKAPASRKKSAKKKAKKKA